MTYLCPHCMNDVGSSLLEYPWTLLPDPTASSSPVLAATRPLGPACRFALIFEGKRRLKSPPHRRITLTF
jgi:hypothetical protein